MAIDLAGAQHGRRKMGMIGRIGPVLRLERDRSEAPQRLAALALELRPVMTGGIELQAGLAGEEIEFAGLGRQRRRVMELVARAFQAEIGVKALIVDESLLEQRRLAEIVIRARYEADRTRRDE